MKPRQSAQCAHVAQGRCSMRAAVQPSETTSQRQPPKHSCGRDTARTSWRTANICCGPGTRTLGRPEFDSARTSSGLGFVSSPRTKAECWTRLASSSLSPATAMTAGNHPFMNEADSYDPAARGPTSTAFTTRTRPERRVTSPWSGHRRRPAPGH